MTESYRPLMLVSADGSRVREAQQFCCRFKFNYCPFDDLPAPGDKLIYVLCFGPDRVEILSQVSKNPGPVYVDFESPAISYRLQFGGGRRELLARAVGLKKGVGELSIIDATAGMAQDALLLANLGCFVTLFERNPVVHCLLEDGIRRGRASSNPELNHILKKFDLRFGKAHFSGDADVAYLDPMFPKRRAHIQANKEMTVFKNIVGEDIDGACLLNLALQSKVKRVVVKRPRLAGDLGGISPSHRITGKSCRFDIYARQKLK